MGLAERMAEGLDGIGGLLRCTTCKREQKLGDIAGHFRQGWPQCCGLTMTWITRRELAEEAASDG